MGYYTARLFSYLETLTGVFFVLLAIRAVMLICGIVILTIPIIDDVLYFFYNLLVMVIKATTNSPILPRFTPQ